MKSNAERISDDKGGKQPVVGQNEHGHVLTLTTAVKFGSEGNQSEIIEEA